MVLGELIERLQSIAMPDRKVYLIINGVRYDTVDVWWQYAETHDNLGYVCVGDDPR